MNMRAAPSIRAWRRSRAATAILAATIAVATALVDRAAASQLPVRTFTTTDGLPGEGITALLEDSRGFLWVGTQTGLARFDGTSFVAYSTADGLPQPGIAALAEDCAGDIWVGTAAGLCRLRPVRDAGGRLFSPVGAREDGAGPSAPEGTGDVGSVTTSRDGTVVATLGASLVRVAAGATPVITTLASGDALYPAGTRTVGTALAEGADGSFWVNAEADVARVCPDGRVERLPIRSSRLAVDAAGNLWSAALELVRYTPIPCGRGGPLITRRVSVLASAASPSPEPGLLATWGERAGFPKAWGQALAATGDSVVRVATTSGLWEVRGDRLRHYGTEQGLAADALSALLVDSAGTLWVGTGTAGLMRVAPPGVVGFTRRDGLPGEKASQVFADGRGGVLVFGFPPATGVCRVRDEVVETARFSLPRGTGELGWAEAQAVVVDHVGDWWVPTGSGLLRFARPGQLSDLASARPREVFGREELGSLAPFRAFEDSRGDLWLGLIEPGRLARWRRAAGSFERFGAAEGLPEEPATAFAETADGAVWAGFYGGGLARLRPGAVRFFSASDGVPRGFVSSLLADRRGRLWVGLLRSGVLEIDDPASEDLTPRHLGRAEGLGSEAVTALAEDRAGRVWIGTRNGADLLEPDRGVVRHVDSSSGLLGNAVVSLAVDEADRVWVATPHGVSRIEPRPRGAPPRLALRIMELRAAGTAYPVPELGSALVQGVRLPAGTGDVEVGYVGVSLAPGESVRYQHRLRGGEWSRAEADRRLSVAGLTPGHYELEVRASRSDGAVSDIARVSFDLAAPLWRRPLALGVEGCALAAAAAVAVRARKRRKAELELVRARIAGDLHDDLGLSLSRIAVLSEVARREADRSGGAGGAELREIGDAARDLIDATSDMAWALDPRADDLPSLLARLRRMMADVFDGSGIVWSFSSPETVPPLTLGAEQRRHVYLILKEAVHNAARHARPSRVAVRVGIGAGTILAEVEDDGAGFDPDADAAAGGHGMQSMRRRARELGGTLEISSRPGAGTRVRLSARTGRTA